MQNCFTFFQLIVAPPRMNTKTEIDLIESLNLCTQWVPTHRYGTQT